MISCGICTAKPFDGSNWNGKYAFETTLQIAGLFRMTSSTQYREFAEECLRLAKQAKDARQRTILKEMAEAWSKLAEAADKRN